MVPDESRAEIHLRIGRLLLASTPREKREETIFEIVNQLNRGSRLITSQQERDQLAELNLIAGKRAKLSTAYASALKYFNAGAALLAADCWQRQYQLTLGLGLERAECEYLNGNFESAEELIKVLLSRGTSKVDKAAAYRLKVVLHIIRAECPEAVESGLKCLDLLGVEMPGHPTPEQFQAEYDEIWENLGERKIGSLVDLPLMTDPEKRAAMQVLAEIGLPAQNTDIKLHYLIIFRLANLSLRHGTTDASTHGYAGLATIIGPVFHRYIDAYGFAKLACSLVEKYGFNAYKARAYLVMEVVSLWTQPVGTAIDLARLSFRAGVETGDLSFACYACNHLITDLLFKGSHLDEVWRESEQCLEFNRNARFRDAADIIVSQQRFIQCMRGYTAALSSFSDAEFDHEGFEAQLTEDRITIVICYYWILKLGACFMFGDYEAANAAARKAERLLWSGADLHIQGVNFHFYNALTITALHGGAGAGEQSESLHLLARSLERLAELAVSCPNNFLDKHTLVSAEVARIEGRDFDAQRLYEKAIRSAQQNGFVHVEALAYETASRFYGARGFEEIARLYLKNARDGYLRWGATGKVRQLEQLYPQLAEENQTPVGSRPIETLLDALDLSTVIEGLRAISGEIQLDKLIHTLLRGALECAGADRGLLILPYGDQFRIEAEIKTGALGVEVQLSQAPAPGRAGGLREAKEEVSPARPGSPKSSLLPDSLLRYVIRTREKVILHDASAHGVFSDEEYIRRKNPRSVLCLPLIRQTKLIGVLYLENSFASGVFTPKRLTILELFASQAAISLDHARIYAELAEENDERKRAEEELRRSEAFLAQGQQIGHTGSWRWQVSTGATYWSAEHFRIFQYDPETDAPSYSLFMERVHPDDRAEFEEVLNQAVRKKSDFKNEYRIVLPGGSIRFLRSAGQPFVSSSGELEFIGTVMDITERKQGEEARQKAQAELAHVSRLAALGELMTLIAHEISQPLGTIANNAGACVRWLGAQNLQEARRSASLVVTDAHRAAEIISGIRALARKAPPQNRWLDLNEMIREMIALTHGELKRNGIILQTRLANNVPEILGDRVQLQQVILNLIINAMEAMSQLAEGLRELSVTSETVTAMLGHKDRTEISTGKENVGPPLTDVQPPYVLVSVADSGPGLDANAFDHLFETFYTTKSQGLGMGLAISRSIIEAHAGRLWATTNTPKGALFQFTLPIGAES
ncbi:MAG: GAF domain-containing protein [Verrucomicrobia bacterium]|nr:GAF domain-containing protein [Verrucomicrobiota bacterium]